METAAHKAGYAAYAQGRWLADNPHPRGTAEFREWQAGIAQVRKREDQLAQARHDLRTAQGVGHSDTLVGDGKMEFPKIALSATGIPLESVGLEGLLILHSDGRKEAFSGFVQYHDETMFDALTRTASEMMATIIFEPEVK